MTSTETPGTRVSESGPNDGNELPSPLSVAHVTGSPEEGIVMARRTNDEQEPQAQVEETEAPGTELETEAPAEVESTEPEAPAEDEESEFYVGSSGELAKRPVEMAVVRAGSGDDSDFAFHGFCAASDDFKR